jgi:2-isopropylmalate synthase
MKTLQEHELIYDWNAVDPQHCYPKRPVELNDESLRDGLQSPSVTDPRIEDKIKILHLMEALGIHGVNIGLPGAGPRAVADVLALAREIAEQRMKIKPNCAARTLRQDIQPIIDVSQKAGVAIEVATFIGSSPIRQYAEDWEPDMMLRRTEEAVKFAVSHNLEVMYVTEDTIRAHPDMIRQLYTTAINFGARRACVCDTVGHATPAGAFNLVTFIKEVIRDAGEEVKIDWHGHCDRGLAVPNTLAAYLAGADRLHGTAIGIGERVGNTQMDLLLINLKLMGVIDNDLSKLDDYCKAVSEACRVPIPHNYPVVGRDAFRTATGVHAAAVIKAEKKGEAWLADLVYSGVPAGMIGRSQEIEIGPMSGESNVKYWLERRNITPDREVVEKIFEKAKRSDRLLADEEIYELIEQARRPRKSD